MRLFSSKQRFGAENKPKVEPWVAAQSWVPRQEGGIGQQWMPVGEFKQIELNEENLPGWNLPELLFGLEKVA